MIHLLLLSPTHVVMSVMQELAIAAPVHVMYVRTRM